MAKIQLEVEMNVICPCGKYLEIIPYDTRFPTAKDTITAKICTRCSEEIRTQAYNKGLEYGRKSKD